MLCALCVPISIGLDDVASERNTTAYRDNDAEDVPKDVEKSDGEIIRRMDNDFYYDDYYEDEGYSEISRYDPSVAAFSHSDRFGSETDSEQGYHPYDSNYFWEYPLSFDYDDYRNSSYNNYYNYPIRRQGMSGQYHYTYSPKASFINYRKNRNNRYADQIYHSANVVGYSIQVQHPDKRGNEYKQIKGNRNFMGYNVKENIKGKNQFHTLTDAPKQALNYQRPDRDPFTNLRHQRFSSSPADAVSSQVIYTRRNPGLKEFLGQSPDLLSAMNNLKFKIHGNNGETDIVNDAQREQSSDESKQISVFPFRYASNAPASFEIEHDASEYESSESDDSESESDGDRYRQKINTITFTQEIPVPVKIEKKIPVPIKIPVDRPFPVYIPKPVAVRVHRPVPFPVKIPVPKLYPVPKLVPYPVKVPFTRSVPVPIIKPYPVVLIKKVPYAVIKPRLYPIKVPVEKPVPYAVTYNKYVPVPVYKEVPVPVKLTEENKIKIEQERDKPSEEDEDEEPIYANNYNKYTESGEEMNLPVHIPVVKVADSYRDHGTEDHDTPTFFKYHHYFTEAPYRGSDDGYDYKDASAGSYHNSEPHGAGYASDERPSSDYYRNLFSEQSADGGRIESERFKDTSSDTNDFEGRPHFYGDTPTRGITEAIYDHHQSTRSYGDRRPKHNYYDIPSGEQHQDASDEQIFENRHPRPSYDDGEEKYPKHIYQTFHESFSYPDKNPSSDYTDREERTSDGENASPPSYSYVQQTLKKPVITYYQGEKPFEKSQSNTAHPQSDESVPSRVVFSTFVHLDGPPTTTHRDLGSAPPFEEATRTEEHRSSNRKVKKSERNPSKKYKKTRESKNKDRDTDSKNENRPKAPEKTVVSSVWRGDKKFSPTDNDYYDEITNDQTEAASMKLTVIESTDLSQISWESLKGPTSSATAGQRDGGGLVSHHRPTSAAL